MKRKLILKIAQLKKEFGISGNVEPGTFINLAKTKATTETELASKPVKTQVAVKGLI